MTAELVIADYSEYQGAVTPPAGQVVIIRAHNGYRPDEFFAANRAAAHAAGAPAVGLYQYLAAARDPAIQAGELLKLTGALLPNEWLICDLEEGQGDQQPRWWAWLGCVVLVTKTRGWLYSGLAFAQAHNLDPDWVAAYGQTEPTIPHKLWQDSDTYPWPWGRSDASVFDGSLPQFLAAAGITLPGPVIPARPLPRPLQEETMQALYNPAGQLTIIGEAADNGNLLVFTNSTGTWAVTDVTDEIAAKNPGRQYQVK